MRHSNVSKCNLFVCMCTSFSIYREIVHWNALEQWLSSEKQRVPNSSTFETAFALTEKGKQWKLLVVSFFFMCFFRFCILNWFAASSNSSYKMLWCFLFNVCVNVCKCVCCWTFFLYSILYRSEWTFVLLAIYATEIEMKREQQQLTKKTER